MKRTLVAALIGALLAGGGTAYYFTQHRGAGNAQLPANASALTLGSLQKGEIRQASAINYGDGTRSQLYRLHAEKGQEFEIDVRGALDAGITVVRDGFLLASSSQDSGYCNDTDSAAASNLLKQSRLLFQADTSGDYVVAVNGSGPYAFGPYELQARQLTASTGPAALTVGQTVDGRGLGSDVSHALTIEQAGLYAIDLQSCHFDALLELQGQGVDLSDDDGAGNGTNARIITWLEPGNYTARARSVSGGPRGEYRIGVTQQSLPAGVTLQRGGVLEPGQPITGLLSQGDSPQYQIRLARPGRLTVRLASTEFDPYMNISGGDQELYDDDSGGGRNGTDARISETLPAGEYTISVSGYGSGLFTLSAEIE